MRAQEDGMRALSRSIAFAAIFIYLLQPGAASAKMTNTYQQPPCDELSIKNPDAVILCGKQYWHQGKVTPFPLAPSSSANTEDALLAQYTHRSKIKEESAHVSETNSVQGEQSTSSYSGVMILILFGVLVFFVMARSKKRSSHSVKIQDSLLEGTGQQQRDLKASEAAWLSKGETVELLGYTIQGGFLYVGSGLKNIQGWRVEPALIDPSLPVDKSLSGRDDSHLSYWPSYSSIEPSARNVYLQWLADGCKDPTIDIGYVFLYFYGLERRALADSKTSATAQAEIPSILEEVKRLHAIYSSSSFQRYATRFIDMIESKLATTHSYQRPPAFNERGYELPFGLKKGLAEFSANGKAIPADWAFSWVMNDPENRLRTPANRCKEEFRKLFNIRYQEKFGEGLMLPQKGVKLRAVYHPASASFGGTVEWIEEGLLDVSAYRGPINQLLKIADACAEELDPYSRYLGRSSKDVSPLVKLALLPALLLKDCENNELRVLNQWLNENITTDKMFTTDIQNIIRRFPLAKSGSFDKRDFISLCQLLAKMGVGLEPDARFGGAMPESTPVVLFKLQSDSINAPTSEYASATVILHLAAAVAGSDGKVSEKEEKHLDEQLGARFNLSPEEKVRLRAHTQWLLASPPSFSGVKKRLESFNQTQRQTLGKFLVSVAQLDGYIDPAEVKILNKIYGILGLDAKELYSNAHMAATEPVKIEDAKAQGPSFVVPKPSHKKKSVSVDLDMKKVEIKLAETAAVATMLSGIFTEDKTLPPIIETVKSEETGNLKHFEPEYLVFIKELLSKTIWTREELEAIAAKSDLLLDGALDSINDDAFEFFDKPFFEGDDPIEINPDILKELQI